MSFTSLLSTVVLVSFLVTIIMAIGSYAAYKLRENRRPVIELPPRENESVYFEPIHYMGTDDTPSDMGSHHHTFDDMPADDPGTFSHE